MTRVTSTEYLKTDVVSKDGWVKVIDCVGYAVVGVVISQAVQALEEHCYAILVARPHVVVPAASSVGGAESVRRVMGRTL